MTGPGDYDIGRIGWSPPNGHLADPILPAPHRLNSREITVDLVHIPCSLFAGHDKPKLDTLV